jgi:hypothetical protein
MVKRLVNLIFIFKKIDGILDKFGKHRKKLYIIQEKYPMYTL